MGLERAEMGRLWRELNATLEVGPRQEAAEWRRLLNFW